LLSTSALRDRRGWGVGVFEYVTKKSTTLAIKITKLKLKNEQQENDNHNKS